MNILLMIILLIVTLLLGLSSIFQSYASAKRRAEGFAGRPCLGAQLW